MRTIDELIADAPTFAGLAAEHLELIAGCAWNMHVDTGTMVMRQGEPADHFFLIRRGTIAIEVSAPGTGPLVIETLHEGDVVGWSWLFAPYRWALDGRAVHSTSLITFDGACLRGKVEHDHELGYQLMRRFAANLIDRLQSTRFQLLDVYGRTPAEA